VFTLFATLSQQVAQFAIDASSNAIAGARLSKEGMEGTGIGKVMGDFMSKLYCKLDQLSFECKDWYEHMRAGFLYKVRQEGWDG